MRFRVSAVTLNSVSPVILSSKTKKKGRKNFGAKENKASSPKNKKKKKSRVCVYVCDEWSTKKGERDTRNEHVYVQSNSLGI